MEDRLLRFPLVCPECGMELLTELSAAAVVQALVTGDSMRFYARCHHRVWQASVIERDQLRRYLRAANLT
jgi:hypothetical protein